MTAFAPLLGLLEEVPDHRRAEGKVYQLAHVLLFSILAIVSGGNSYRSIATFIEMHHHRLNDVFGLTWRRAPAHTAIRYILQGLDSSAVEAAFRRHANLLQAAHAKPGGGSLAIDGKTLRGSFDGFRDRAAAHLLGGHCQVVGLMGAFDHAARHPLMFTLRFGRTSPAARSGRPWREHCGTRSRSSDAAADGSGRRSWRGMIGSAGPAPAT